MSWNAHYIIGFAALDGTHHAVKIYEQNYAGAVEMLTGSARPFVTNENDSDSPFAPLRGQTGKIGILADLDLVETIMPQNNIQKMVRLWRGAWNNGTFTESVLEWQGFLCAEAYTQPLDGQEAEIELPVKSVLSALEDVSLDIDTMSGAPVRLGQLLVDAVSALGITPWETVHIISDIDPDYNLWAAQYAPPEAWTESDTIQDGGDQLKIFKGKTYAQIMSDVASFFGMTLRENATSLYCVQYDDNVGNIKHTSYTWSQWVSLSGGSTPPSVAVSDVYTRVLMDSATWRGTDNSLTFTPGRRKASVVLSLHNDDEPVIEQPSVSDAYQVPTRMEISDGVLFVADHSGTADRETFTYSAYSGTTRQRTGASTLNDCVQHAAFKLPYSVPYTDGTTLYTGAIPVRWSLRTEDEPIKAMSSGLWIVGQHKSNPLTDKTCYDMYAIESGRKMYFRDGYLDLTATLYAYYYAPETAQTVENRHLIRTQKFNEVFMVHNLMVSLQVGNEVWDSVNRTWVTSSADPRTYAFPIEFRGPNVRDNYNGEPIRHAAGFLVPVSNLSGKVVLRIYDFGASWFGSEPNPYSYLRDSITNYLLSQLKIEYQPVVSEGTSDRDSNAYVMDIPYSGFSEEESVGLSVGTINNNTSSPQFILNASASGYLYLLQYMNPTPTRDRHQRPEEQLLARLAVYYAKARRTMECTLTSNLDLMAYRYSLKGHTFFGVDAAHDWRDNKSQVKFIEVK